MSNTYTNVRIHFVFAVKFRRTMLHRSWRDELFMYMTGIVQRNNHKLIAINGIEDHVHILIGLNSHQSIAELMQHVKADSSKWINERKLTPGRFRWQEGYGAFSHSQDNIPKVIEYIQKQEENHARKSFQKEYRQMLERFEVEYNDRYVFHDPE
jgi:REP element-mobilizing transposase RayT